MTWTWSIVLSETIRQHGRYIILINKILVKFNIRSWYRIRGVVVALSFLPSLIDGPRDKTHVPKFQNKFLYNIKDYILYYILFNNFYETLWKITTGIKKLNLLVLSNYLRRPVLVRINPTTVEIKLEKIKN